MNGLFERRVAILVGMVALFFGFFGGTEISYGQAWLVGGFDAAIPAMPGPADYVYAPGYPSSLGGWGYRNGTQGYIPGCGPCGGLCGSVAYDGWMNRGWRFRRGWNRCGMGVYGCGRVYRSSPIYSGHRNGYCVGCGGAR